ncbi:hypothetical protein HOLleu_21184 [Holothuria leucospilota]|uniref:Uncharacterized protein n=1 Tax=Holothuria leucospilota TaxID=206669 RepID=A0A9Q1H5V1_HOLLE|nr:hypothetical protein HOLleu_21184 [Holothuria leucospilota]
MQPSETGIWHSSILNELAYFHVSDNYAVDIMHDIYEVVAPKEIKLVIGALINQKLFTLEELNRRILSYSYGYKYEENRPSPIFASSLNNPGGASGQTAAQSVCLVKYLPLIIGDKVPQGCDCWEILLLLFDIFKIISATWISSEGTIYLRNLVEEHYRLYLSKFSDQHLTPKQHFMTQYHRIIRQLGPLNQYSCMRFEGKHKSMKNYARLCNNFQNIAKTLPKKHQTNQSYKCLLKEPVGKLQCDLFDQSVVHIASLEAAEILVQELNISLLSDVTITGRVVIKGCDFRVRSIIMLPPEDVDNDALFSQIISIVVEKKEVYVLVKDMETLYYERHYQAFAVNICSYHSIVFANTVIFWTSNLYMHLSHTKSRKHVFSFPAGVAASKVDCMAFISI